MTNEQPAGGVDEARRAAMAAASKRIDQVQNWLQVGGAIAPDDYERLRAAGVTHIVDLREEHEVDADSARLTQLGIERRHVPVPNRHAPTTPQMLDVIDWFPADTDDVSLYVHCQGGFGRAGTMAVGLLVQSGLTLEQAEQEVRAVRPEININDEQRAWLQSLEQGRA